MYQDVIPANPAIIERDPGQDWRELQVRAAAILSESGMATEVAKTIELARGRAEIDVYAENPNSRPRTVYLCECKRWRARVPQAEVQAFRTIVADAGAHVGLFISAMGFQAGAEDVVRNTNVHLLDWDEFQEMFAEDWCKNHFAPTIRRECAALANHVDPSISDAAIREARGEALTEAEAVGSMISGFWTPPFMAFGDLQDEESIIDAIWREREAYARFLPPGIRDAMTLRELLDETVRFSRAWLEQRRPARD